MLAGILSWIPSLKQFSRSGTASCLCSRLSFVSLLFTERTPSDTLLKIRKSVLYVQTHVGRLLYLHLLLLSCWLILLRHCSAPVSLNKLLCNSSLFILICSYNILWQDLWLHSHSLSLLFTFYVSFKSVKVFSLFFFFFNCSHVNIIASTQCGNSVLGEDELKKRTVLYSYENKQQYFWVANLFLHN